MKKLLIAASLTLGLVLTGAAINQAEACPCSKGEQTCSKSKGDSYKSPQKTAKQKKGKSAQDKRS